MKYYIVGAGGIGGYFGGLMVNAGLDVTFVARGKNYKTIKEKGLQINSNSFESFHLANAKVIDGVDKIVNPNVIIFSVKTYDTEKVSKELKKVINDKTIIITFQNGVDNDERIKKILNHKHVFPGVAYILVKKSDYGVIEQTGKMRKLIIGARDRHLNVYLKPIIEDIKTSKVETTLSEDIIKDLWEKFLYIIPLAGSTAICRSPLGKIRNDKYSMKIFEDLLKESILVATKKGINISKNIFQEKMELAKNSTPDAKSSLLIDIENNRPTEIETLHGAIVKYAKELKVPVPITELVYGSIKIVNK
jgi:2-dehydropantoate 2-reductase